MPRQWFEIIDAADSEPVRIDIYGDIGESYWDDDAVSAADLLNALSEFAHRDIDLHVNSGGGSVFDAFAMMTALRAHDGRVTAYVDGLAASAASYLIAAADRVMMSSVAWLMIHNASGLVLGNAADMRKTAEELDQIDAAIAAIYSKRSGSDHDFAADMAAETWLDAARALELGLVDEVEEAVAVAAHVDWHDAHLLDHAPAEAVAALSEPADDAEGNAPASISDSSEPEDGGEAGQEPEQPQAQERVVVLDGIARTIRTTEQEA